VPRCLGAQPQRHAALMSHRSTAYKPAHFLNFTSLIRTIVMQEAPSLKRKSRSLTSMYESFSPGKRFCVEHIRLLQRHFPQPSPSPACRQVIVRQMLRLSASLEDGELKYLLLGTIPIRSKCYVPYRVSFSCISSASVGNRALIF